MEAGDGDCEGAPLDDGDGVGAFGGGVAEGSDDGCRLSVGLCDWSWSVDCAADSGAGNAIVSNGKRKNVMQMVGKNFCIGIKRIGIKVVRCVINLE